MGRDTFALRIRHAQSGARIRPDEVNLVMKVATLNPKRANAPIGPALPTKRRCLDAPQSRDVEDTVLRRPALLPD